MKKKHEVVVRGYNHNYIVTIAIGKKTLNHWNMYAKKSWVKYCKKNFIGLIVIKDHIIDKSSIKWKKPTWQKFLLGNYLLKHEKKKIKNICYLDTDILINVNSPNVFEYHKENKFSVVSEIDLPFERLKILKKISFFRKKYYSKRYKLNSSILFTHKEKFQYDRLPIQKNYFCAGLIIFNKRYFALMSKWFFKHKSNLNNLTGGGDENIMNYEVLNYGKVNYLNYKFQALWLYEMANNYSFLYKFKNKKNKIIDYCIDEAIFNNYFLHFPGSWHEGNMWKNKNLNKLNNRLHIYLKKKIKAKPYGRILPK